jgi:hypothetical protein
LVTAERGIEAIREFFNEQKKNMRLMKNLQDGDLGDNGKQGALDVTE